MKVEINVPVGDPSVTWTENSEVTVDIRGSQDGWLILNFAHGYEMLNVANEIVAERFYQQLTPEQAVEMRDSGAGAPSVDELILTWLKANGLVPEDGIYTGGEE